MYKSVQYFKGLNALRFFAAYFVVMHHAEQIRLKNDLFHLKRFSVFDNGGIAVTFFFVLSGFLITYLLLRELSQTRDISINKFYIRRILRIWPLYYLLVIIGTLIIPLFLSLIDHPYEMPYTFSDVILYYVFFAPFIVNVLFGHHLLDPLWSIGVEEVFYILWAPLLKFLKQHVLKIIIAIIILRLTLLALLPVMDLSSTVVHIIKMLEFESLAFGGLAAYILFNRKKRIEQTALFSKWFQIAALTLVFLRVTCFKVLTENSETFNFLFTVPILSHVILIASFAWLIVNVSVNEKSILPLNNRVLNFLGEISYGVYMYHMLIVFSIILILKSFLASLSGVPASILYYLLISTGVVITSYLSKRFFEDYFLKLKSKFRSTHNIQNEAISKNGRSMSHWVGRLSKQRSNFRKTENPQDT